jgi:hypothetical protein
MLVVDRKEALSQGLKGAAKYEDGTRPRPVEVPKPAAVPVVLVEDEAAKALVALTQAIAMQTGDAAAQRETLLAVVKSNEGLAQAIIAKMTEKPSMFHVEPKPTAEEWVFEHIYEYGDVKRTIARRIK